VKGLVFFFQVMKQTFVNLFQPWKKRELYDLCNTVREDDEESLHNLRHWLLQHKKHSKRFMEAAGYVDEWNNTPLHWIVMHQPPADVRCKYLRKLICLHTYNDGF
jgi:hypothetical protein